MLVLRYATDLVPVGRMLGLPCMLCDRGIVSASESDISTMFMHSFADWSTSFANVDLITCPARDLINYAVASIW